MANTVSDYAGHIVAMYKDVVATYEKNAETIKRIDRELVDIEHAIELGPSQNAYQGYLLYKQIRELRIERRACKNANELMKDMYEYLRSKPAQDFKAQMQQLQSNANKLQETQEHRVYTPRERHDLDVGAKPTQDFEAMLKEAQKNKPRVKNGKLRK